MTDENTAPATAGETMGTQPAFPFVEPADVDAINPGLTIREHFAGLALQGLLAGGHLPRGSDNYEHMCARLAHNAVLLAHNAVLMADALLTELAR